MQPAGLSPDRPAALRFCRPAMVVVMQESGAAAVAEEDREFLATLNAVCALVRLGI